MVELSYRRWNGPIADAAAPLLALVNAVFAEFDDSYLLDRLPSLTDPDLWIAERAGEWVGFKLGYGREPNILYSWLGGVVPAMRRQGVADALMERQHAHAREAGYRVVETRSRAVNSAMIIINLRHGFQVAGFEIDPRGIAVVIQRKTLTVA